MGATLSVWWYGRRGHTGAALHRGRCEAKRMLYMCMCVCVRVRKRVFIHSYVSNSSTRTLVRLSVRTLVLVYNVHDKQVCKRVWLKYNMCACVLLCVFVNDVCLHVCLCACCHACVPVFQVQYVLTRALRVYACMHACMCPPPELRWSSAPASRRTRMAWPRNMVRPLASHLASPAQNAPRLAFEAESFGRIRDESTRDGALSAHPPADAPRAQT